MNKFGVIMAGGGGTRFWPLSRQSMPKQLLNLSGRDILINETIERNLPVIPEENIYIITAQNQGDKLKSLVTEKVKRDNILLEPVGRNTAACIGYAAKVIEKRHGDGVICVFPSDAYIKDTDAYAESIELACKAAEETNNIVVIGMKPTYAATGYGYIKRGENKAGDGIYPVERFVEKPDHKTAGEYLLEGSYLWNCGIIIVRTSIILESIKRFLPKLHKQLNEVADSIDTETGAKALEEAYPKFESISIDYGVLERCDNLLVIPGDFGWSDIGTWDTLGTVFPPDEDGNIVKGDHIGIETQNSVIYSDRLVATIGVEDLIIVSVDDAILVCPKDKAQEIKDIVEILKKKSQDRYL